MGMFRDADSQEIDIVKEMAESLGSTGLRLEEILERLELARDQVDHLVACHASGRTSTGEPDVSIVNDSIQVYNTLVDKAEHARSWLLIQREACGFRTHRDVDFHYPIPAKMKFLE